MRPPWPVSLAKSHKRSQLSQRTHHGDLSPWWAVYNNLLIFIERCKIKSQITVLFLQVSLSALVVVNQTSFSHQWEQSSVLTPILSQYLYQSSLGVGTLLCLAGCHSMVQLLIRSQPDQDTVKVINNRLSSKVNSLEWYNHTPPIFPFLEKCLWIPFQADASLCSFVQSMLWWLSQ